MCLYDFTSPYEHKKNMDAFLPSSSISQVFDQDIKADGSLPAQALLKV